MGPVYGARSGCRRNCVVRLLAMIALFLACDPAVPEPGVERSVEPPSASPAGERPAAEPVAEGLAPAPSDDVPHPSGEPAADEPPADEPPPPPPDPLHGEVAAGDSLSRLLSRAGLSAAEIARVTAALSPVMDPATIQIGQRYDIELDERGLVEFSFRLSVTERARVRRQDDDSLLGEHVELPTTMVEERIEGEIDSSLWAALTERGHSPALVDVIVDVFAYDIDFFTATRKGDRFALVVQRHELDGTLVRYGQVLAAEYEGSAAGQHRVYWWAPKKGDPQYVDDDGRGVARTIVKSPLKYARISSGFNPKRMHPVLHRVKSHQGVDYAAPEGTPVWAAADGTIVFRAKKGGAGNMVIMRHAGGLKTLYMHLSRFADDQKVGAKIKAKTVIGYVGMTGLATGPHLHFGMQKNGRYVDPTTIESVRARGVAKGDRRNFARFRDRWRDRLSEPEPVADEPVTDELDDAAADEPAEP